MQRADQREYPGGLCVIWRYLQYLLHRAPHPRSGALCRGAHRSYCRAGGQGGSGGPFIRNTTEADGIISTRQSFIRRAKELGLAAILRVFLLDSIALESLDKIPANLPDCLDLLPGAMPKILRRVCAKAKVPVLTGGLIADKEDVMAALEAGATAISTTNQAVWDM